MRTSRMPVMAPPPLQMRGAEPSRLRQTMRFCDEAENTRVASGCLRPPRCRTIEMIPDQVTAQRKKNETQGKMQARPRSAARPNCLVRRMLTFIDALQILAENTRSVANDGS